MVIRYALGLASSSLVLTSICLAGSRPASPLNPKLLQHAYKPHRVGKEIVVSSPKWSPDRRQAFYIIVEKDSPALGDSWNTLFAVRRDGSHIRKLCQWRRQESGGRPDGNSFRWSPDSSRILFRTTSTGSVNLDGVDLVDVNPETGERRKLSRDLNGKPGTGEILTEPAYCIFSPDGKYLLLTLGGDRITLYNKRLVRIEYATGKRQALTSAQMTSLAGVWSPDGKQIAYIAAPDAFRLYSSDNTERFRKEKPYQHLHLYLMSADGRQKRQLTQDKRYFEQQPAWSPDRRTISFVRYTVAPESSSRSLWTIRPDGTGLTRVRDLPSKQWTPYPPSYTPD